MGGPQLGFPQYRSFPPTQDCKFESGSVACLRPTCKPNNSSRSKIAPWLSGKAATQFILAPRSGSPDACLTLLPWGSESRKLTKARRTRDPTGKSECKLSWHCKEPLENNAAILGKARARGLRVTRIASRSHFTPCDCGFGPRRGPLGNCRRIPLREAWLELQE